MKLSVFHCYLIAGLLLLQDIHGLLSTCFNDLSRSLFCGPPCLMVAAVTSTLYRTRWLQNGAVQKGVGKLLT